MIHPFIEGERIYLRGLEKTDLQGNMFHWANDADVTYFMIMGAMPSTLEQMEIEYDQLSKSGNNVVFAIIDKETGSHIGNVGLYGIRWLVGAAEYRIIVGEKDFWNKGYGTESAKLVVDYSFKRLNLNKVFLGVNAEHKGAIKSYFNAGFVHEGVLRQEIYRNGRYYDAVRMSILRSEYLTQ